MEMQGEYRIPARREQVWAALNDPEILKACIPGCETLEQTSDTGFAATVALKVGPVRAKFAGAVELSDIDPPNGYTISGEGKGGAAGFAKGGAKVDLAEDGEETILRYDVQANVGGKLAQLGSRLIDGTARKLAEDFFAKFSELAAAKDAPGSSAEAPAAAEEPAPVVSAPAADGPAAATEVPPEVVKEASQVGEASPEMLNVRGDASEHSGQPPHTEARTPGGLPNWLWVVGTLIVVVILLWIFNSAG